MKILLSHRYFWPDSAPYALLLRSIGMSIAKDGHSVHVFASQPSYRGREKLSKQQIDSNLSIRRCWVFPEHERYTLLRFLNVVLYCIGLAMHIIRVRPNIVTASTFPPVLAAWTASCFAKLIGAKFIYHIQDIHPEISKTSGGLLGSRFISSILTWLDNQSLNRAAAIVVLSDDMANTIKARLPQNLPISVINNFPLDPFNSPSVGKQKTDTITFIFAGNLGRFQSLDTLLEGVVGALEARSNARLVLLGDGVMAENLKLRWSNHAQVSFHPFENYETAKLRIAACQVGLLSLRKDLYRLAYPSKLQTYIHLGLPVIAAIEPQSNLASEILRYNCGVVPTRNDHAAITEACIEMIDNLRDFQIGAALALPITNMDDRLKLWTSLINELDTHYEIEKK